MRRRSRHSVVSLLVALLLATGAASALAQNAQISGTVSDQSGGVVPGTTVTARNQETGLVRQTVSDEAGTYRLPALPPGSYTITVELQGFSTETRRDLVLAISQTAVLNYTLKTAALAETITVTSSAPIVDTTRSDVTTSVSSQQIQDLPLANTRWIAFAMLTPGVSQDNIRNQYYPGTVDVGGDLHGSGMLFFRNTDLTALQSFAVRESGPSVLEVLWRSRVPPGGMHRPAVQRVEPRELRRAELESGFGGIRTSRPIARRYQRPVATGRVGRSICVLRGKES